MATWKRKPQEQKGNYWFTGTCYLTAGVDQEIPKDEIAVILNDLHIFVQVEQGIDYLQVYTNESGRKLWIIDQVPKDELVDHPVEHNHYTILFPHEYGKVLSRTCSESYRLRLLSLFYIKQFLS